MEARTQSVKNTWVWLVAMLVFFINSFALPQGLTFTLLLTPVWLYLLRKHNRLDTLPMLMMPLVIYAFVHIMNGVSMGYYIVSLLMLVSVICFALVAIIYFNDPEVNWDGIFRSIVIVNFVLAIASIPLLYIPFLKPLVWYMVPISKGIENIPRLKLFTSEASHYSFWLAPISIYFFSRMIFFKTKNNLPTLLMLCIPLILSFSMGVLLCLIVTGIMVVVLYANRALASKRRRQILTASVLLTGIALLALFVVFPHNPIYLRIHNIFSGDDTSARGRTYEAFILANKIIAQKSVLWGIGPGQLKIDGRSIIIQYYSYLHIPEVVRIPNACAETIVYFGYIGLAIRLLLQAVLFFATKVYNNPYRLWLFLFMFIYQFTGSYITNVAEYMVWIMAFSPMFPEYVKVREASITNPDMLKPAI
ncbi:MAG: hypothetical protein EOP51_07785 [Sphingobacteriales bacterium]|nr:MAG: hypothetical protein EOP51_07785 [Sphingobacteriales bacterium]